MTTIDREQAVVALDAWLGDARTDLTPEQYARALDESIALHERYPGEDDAEDHEAAMSATVQYLLDETSPRTAGRELACARAELRAAMVSAQQVARLAVGDGWSEVRAAEACGLDRMTVRKALGKR